MITITKKDIKVVNIRKILMDRVDDVVLDDWYQLKNILISNREIWEFVINRIDHQRLQRVITKYENSISQ